MLDESAAITTVHSVEERSWVLVWDVWCHEYSDNRSWNIVEYMAILYDT